MTYAGGEAPPVGPELEGFPGGKNVYFNIGCAAGERICGIEAFHIREGTVLGFKVSPPPRHSASTAQPRDRVF